MLVNGWTFDGACCSSYDYTMSFRASAQVADLSTRKAVTPPPESAVKSNSYPNIINLQFKTVTLGRVAPATWSEGQTNIAYLFDSRDKPENDNKNSVTPEQLQVANKGASNF